MHRYRLEMNARARINCNYAVVHINVCWDTRARRTQHKPLRPGGVLSQISMDKPQNDAVSVSTLQHRWRFTRSTTPPTPPSTSGFQRLYYDDKIDLLSGNFTVGYNHKRINLRN